MAWNASEFDGLSQVYLSSRHVWTPDIYLTNRSVNPRSSPAYIFPHRQSNFVRATLFCIYTTYLPPPVVFVWFKANQFMACCIYHFFSSYLAAVLGCIWTYIQYERANKDRSLLDNVNTTSRRQLYTAWAKKQPTHICACVFQMLWPNLIIFDVRKQQVKINSAMQKIHNNIHYEGTTEMN